MSKSSLCQECFDAQYPGASVDQKQAQEVGCIYCGKEEGTRVCRRCQAEVHRFMRENKISMPEGNLTKEQKAEPIRIINQITDHMKKWVLEHEPDPSHDAGHIPAPAYPLDSVLEPLAAADSRYTVDAYRTVARAVHEALSAANNPNSGHVSGRDVALAFRSLVSRELGREAMPTLVRWGLYTTADIGTIVFSMVGAGILCARDQDTAEDFQAVYDFATAFPTT